MVFHENRLLADDSHEISYLIFFRKLKKMSQNLLSAAVVIGTLRVNLFPLLYANVSPMLAHIIRNIEENQLTD